jgi:gluconokinase
VFKQQFYILVTETKYYCMRKPYIVGIDIGTGSTKAVSMDLDGNVLHVSQCGYPTLNPEPGYSEQNPEDIWEGFKSCVNDTVQQMGYSPEAISLSSAMHSFIPVDRDGNPLHNMITWADARSEALAEILRESAEAEFIYNTSGTPIHAMSPLCKLLWLKGSNKILFEESHKFISIKEYIWFKLFNTFEIDYGIASATGLFDIIKLQWSAEIMEIAGITADKLSNPVNTNFCRKIDHPEVLSSLGLEHALSVVIGSSDGCCANLGSAVSDDYKAALTIGTSAAVRVTTTAPVYNFKAMTFNYLLDQNTFVCGGPLNNGGVAIDWAIEKFLNKQEPDEADYDYFFKQVESTSSGSGGLIFVPYLTGERAPIWDTAVTASFVGLQLHHGQAHFFRAVLEGVCMAINEVLLAVEQATMPIKQLNISGGFLNAPVWMQVLANVTGKKLVVVQADDASAIGAIILAARALHPKAKLEEKLSQETQTIMPDYSQHEVYKKLQPVYGRLYDDLKTVMHTLKSLAL